MSGDRGPTPEEEATGRAWQLLCELVLDNVRRREVSDTLGLSFGRIKALRRIAVHPMLTMGELAALLGIDAPATTVAVDDLETRGLVERRPHPTDRRAKVVVATTRGTSMARQAQAILNRPPERLAALPPGDVAELLRILGGMSDGEAAGEPD